MKIEDIEYVYRKVPMEKAFTTATGGVSNSSSFFVRIITDEGIVGYGCGYPTSFTDEDARSASYFSDLFKQSMKGLDPLRRERVLSAMESVTFGNPSLKFAFDTAVWDIFGKYHDAPLYKLLGGDKPKIRSSITIGMDETEKMVRDAVYWKRKGFDYLKVKLGPDLDNDIEVIRALREELGQDVFIRCDANGSLSLGDAKRFVMSVKDMDIEFLEQPVTEEADMVNLTETSPVRIVADETIRDRFHLQSLLHKNAFHIANIKLNRFGGISQGLKMISACELSEKPCMLGCMSENAISIAASLHLALALGNVHFADLDTFLFLKYQPAKGISLKNGYLRPSSYPGLGITIENKIFKKARPS